ncbi:MAG: PEP-CTERM sorting domain-containing protein [Phycisphaerae bacterium]|nr:PEP-CTERM sorting domain-containing protein [Phycisphaerae bacterium]
MPMINTLIEGTPYYGHDELSTAWKLPEETEYAGVFMADDFADPFDTPVLHITWWGSYMNNVPSEMVNQFMIVFENDVPVNAPGNEKGFSYPDPIGYQAQVVTRGMLAPGSGTFTETLIPGSNPDEPVYMYNAELACPFAQQPDTVYWLKIVALVDALPGNPEHLQWGWHNRDYTIQDPYASVPPNVVPGEYLDGTLPCGTEIWHFQDDAVTGTVTNIAILGPNPCDVHQDQNPDNYMECYYVDEVDGPDGIGTHSKDLAFVLYTPEPATISLMVIGAAAMLRRRKRS